MISAHDKIMKCLAEFKESGQVPTRVVVRSDIIDEILESIPMARVEGYLLPSYAAIPLDVVKDHLAPDFWFDLK